jgi:hypothetical protein
MSTKFSHGAFRHRKNAAQNVWDLIYAYGWPSRTFSKASKPIEPPKDYAAPPKRGFIGRSIQRVKNFFTRKI